MTAFLHLLGHDGVVGADVVVDDVVAMNAARVGVHVVVAGKDALVEPQRRRLGPALLDVEGPGTGPGLRDVLVLSALQRTLRDLVSRHGDVVVHAHGGHARTIAALLAGGTTVVVDDGDDRPAHRVLPVPDRICFTSHGDLDRALEAGLLARRAALTGPGVDVADTVGDRAADIIVVDAVVDAVAVALRTIGLRPTSLNEPQALRARAAIVGPDARLRPALVRLVARGTPTFAIRAPWADDLARFASFSIVDADDVDLAGLTQLVLTSTPRAARKVPKLLARPARTQALGELYETLGPAPTLAPMGRPPRRRPRR